MQTSSPKMLTRAAERYTRRCVVWRMSTCMYKRWSDMDEVTAKTSEKWEFVVKKERDKGFSSVPSSLTLFTGARVLDCVKARALAVAKSRYIWRAVCSVVDRYKHFQLEARLVNATCAVAWEKLQLCLSSLAKTDLDSPRHGCACHARVVQNVSSEPPAHSASTC